MNTSALMPARRTRPLPPTRPSRGGGGRGRGGPRRREGTGNKSRRRTETSCTCYGRQSFRPGDEAASNSLPQDDDARKHRGRGAEQHTRTGWGVHAAPRTALRTRRPVRTRRPQAPHRGQPTPAASVPEGSPGRASEEQKVRRPSPTQAHGHLQPQTRGGPRAHRSTEDGLCAKHGDDHENQTEFLTETSASESSASQRREPRGHRASGRRLPLGRAHGPCTRAAQAATLKVRTWAKLEEQAFLAQRREGGRMNRPTGPVGNREPTKTAENNAMREEESTNPTEITKSNVS